MHAVLVTIALDPTKADEAVEFLNGFAVPMIKQGAGFVSGTWIRSADGTRGHSMLLYKTEQAASDAAARAAQGPPPGAPITFEAADVFEVLAQA